MKKYLEESARTIPTEHKLRTDLVSDFEFVHAATAAVLKIKELDAMKKALVYGKDPGPEIKPMELDDQFESYAPNDVVHAILGIVTEAGELLELLLDKNQYSYPKLVDEAGDCLWYLALLFRKIGMTFEEVGEKNIQKLKVRYPDKFTAELAIHRNDAQENLVFAN